MEQLLIVVLPVGTTGRNRSRGMTGLFSLFSPPFSLFLCLTQSLSSLSSSLLSLLFILLPSFTSLSGRQRDDGFVAVVTPPFSHVLLAPAASADDDTATTNTTVFSRRNGFVVSVRKQK